MRDLQIALQELSDKDQEELLYKLNFVKGLELRKENGNLNISFPHTADKAALSEKIITLVADIKKGKKVGCKRIFESTAKKSAYSGNVYDELLRQKRVVSYRSGLVSVDQMLSAIMEYFDKRFQDIAHSFKAEVQTYPTLIPVEILEKCNYFESFPQYVNFVTHIEEDHDRIHSFNNSWVKRRENGFVFDEYFKMIECVLSPAVCFHAYKRCENESIEPNTNKVITAKGKCFRYESSNMKTLERLWDFTMREIVFIGEQQFVNDRRKESIRYLSSFIDELGLTGYIEVANDPFFTSSAAQKKVYQLGFELKYEIKLHLPHENKEIAVGSFNIHEDFFGKTFNINVRDKGAAFTGCTAFGLERWAYAFLSQYGLENHRWPNDVKEYVISRTNEF